MSQLDVNRINDASGGVLAPISSVMRNRIINGAMTVSQRSTSSVSNSLSSTGLRYDTIDRWGYWAQEASKFTVQQNAGSVTPPAGFTNYLGITSSTALSVAAGSYYSIAQRIEGFNFADLNFGTASAKTFTVSFWVRSSLTGTFPCYFHNNNYTRTYVSSFVINSANTWEQKSVTIVGDTTGTWLTTNGQAIEFGIGLAVGSTYQATANTWGTTSFAISPSGCVNLLATNGATFYITGVQLEVGTQATSFEYRQYGQELALCQRYLQVWGGAGSQMLGTAWSAGTTNTVVSALRPVTMRVSPTLTSSTVSDWTVFNGGAGSLTVTSIVQNRPSPYSTSMEFGVSSGLTSGQAGAVFTGNANARVYESAEL